MNFSCYCVCIVGDIKTKISNIRGSFSREIKEEEKCSRSGSSERTSHPYKYTNMLTFLRKHMRIDKLKDNLKRKVSIEMFSMYNYFRIPCYCLENHNQTMTYNITSFIAKITNWRVSTDIRSDQFQRNKKLKCHVFF